VSAILKKFRLLAIILFWQYGVSYAQLPHVKFLSLEQGISNPNALDIVHDNQGIVWIATELGLNRFAANSFDHYYKSEQKVGSSINSNEINKLLYDDQYLYIGTRANGLNVLDIKSGKFSYYTHDSANKKSIATNDITDILKGSDGAIWLSTYHHGVEKFNQVSKEFEHFDTQSVPGLPSNSIWSIVEDQQGLLYIGHVNDGVSILNKQTGQLKRLHVDNAEHGIPHNEIKVLLCDHKNNIWIGTRKGLTVYNPISGKLKRINLSKDTIAQPFIYALAEINQEIWVGTESSKLHVIKPIYESAGDIPVIQDIRSIDIGLGRHVSIQKISSDKFGNIWLAFYGGGIGFISHFNPFFETIQGTNAIINGIVSRSQNTMTLVTEGKGLLQLQVSESSSRTTKLSNALLEDFLLSGFQDRNKNLWIGLKNQGVSFFHANTKQWKPLNVLDALPEVRTITEDHKGHIWFGTNRGVVIYDPKYDRIEKLTLHEPALGDYAPRALVEDVDGNMWVGTYGQGIYVFNTDKKQIAHFTSANGLKSNSINHLFRDSKNNIWIATNEGIALQSNHKKLGALQIITPPKTNAWLFIQAIVEDQDGNIWCSTKSGLLRYLPEKKRFFSYDQDFGIPLGGFKNNSVALNEQGQLFFGMQDGLCFFDPKDVPITLTSSPIYIGSFTAFQGGESPRQTEKYIPHHDNIKLGHNENSFRITFGVSDYALQGLTEFSYQLKGRDQEWTFIGNEQALNFRNIPYGTYELLIRTRQKNENWSSDITSLSIDIKPPYYLRTYAKVIYTMFGGGILFAIIFFYQRKIKAEGELRLKKLEHQQQQQLTTERLNFFTIITHELRTPLTLILGPLDDLLEEKTLSPKQKNLVQVIQKSSNRLFSLVNQLLEFRKVESQHKPLVLNEGYLGEVVQDVVNKYVELNLKEKLQIRGHLPVTDIRTTFDADIVHIILDNLLSNAYKYTTVGTIDVSLSYEQDRLNTWSVLRVKDTGSGIPEEYLTRIFDRFFQIDGTSLPGTGIGLAIVKELVAVHHGKIEVRSLMGQGSEFCIHLLTNRVAEAVQPLVNNEEVILLVEDDIDLRQYLTSTLESHYKVITADNGKEGFEKANDDIPDLIISDVMMAGGDGFEMVHKLKERRETSHIPVILLTAKDSDIDKQKGYELGVDSYLIKPILPILLIKRIENILSNRKIVHDYLMQKTSLRENPHSNLPEGLWKDNTFVQEFIEIVEKHMQDDVLETTKLAEKMNMSHSTLYRKLKALTGKNINQLVRKIRIQKAAELLRSGQYNVTEVSFMVGIHSPIYFRQCFKDEFGQLPSEYQKNSPQSP